MQPGNLSQLVKIAGRSIRCDSSEDRALLLLAKSIEVDPGAADAQSIGRLYLVRDVCQRYGVGKSQRLVKMAIDRLERSAPA
jgi:hypothetical protein